MKRILNKLISGLVISSSIAGVLSSCSKEEVKKYIVTFNVNGGTPLNYIEVLEGGKINPPGEPTKDNYLFSGWYEDEGLTKAFDFTQPINNDINLFAKWIKHETQLIVVSDYCDSTGQEDCADIIQSLIDDSPNKTLFFRDGTYILSHPIKTYSNPDKTTNLLLSGFATLKASDTFEAKRPEEYEKKEWEDDYNYMVQLGVDRVNSIEPKAFFSFSGGIVDGNDKAAGIEITGGREVQINNTVIRNTEIGIKVAKGVNGSDSADANIHDVSISGNNSNTSIGFWCDASDSHYTNIRTIKTHTGVKQTRAGHNFYTNVHVVGRDMTTTDYNTSVGFDISAVNWFKNCYSDCFHTAWLVKGKLFADNCVAWFHKTASKEADVAINCQVNMNSLFNNFVCGFQKHVDETVTNTVLTLADGKSLKDGKINNIIIGGRDTLLDDDLYKQCHTGIDMDY